MHILKFINQKASENHVRTETTESQAMNKETHTHTHTHLYPLTHTRTGSHILPSRELSRQNQSLTKKKKKINLKHRFRTEPFNRLSRFLIIFRTWSISSEQKKIPVHSWCSSRKWGLIHLNTAFPRTRTHLVVLFCCCCCCSCVANTLIYHMLQIHYHREISTEVKNICSNTYTLSRSVCARMLIENLKSSNSRLFPIGEVANF